ncbi:MAG: nitrilase-related carbon-nitrogen hydrolase [Gammaproteobacteria bacterium]
MTVSEAPSIYYALALQTRCHAINKLNASEARQSINDSIARIAKQIAAAKGFIGPDLRLVVLPEYFLTGFPMGDAVDAWAGKAALATDGPEYAALGKICQDNDLFLSGNVYELDKNFAGLYFQTSFIIDPGGSVIHRYRRLISLFAPTPHDVWDKYLDIYGIDGIFPVTETAIGKLATVASEEILYPEISRAFALRGAEVLLHSTSEIGSPQPTPKAIAKRARAIENQAYLISANSAGISGIDIPESSTDGMSGIIDYHGHILTAAAGGESMVANHALDLHGLRYHRQRPGMANMLSRQRLELFRTAVGDDSRYPANTLIDAKGKHIVPDRKHFIQTQQAVIATLQKAGLI